MVIRAKKRIKFGDHALHNIADAVLMYQNKNLGKRLKADGWIVHSYQGVISHILFSKESTPNKVTVHSRVNLDTLAKMVSEAKKRRTYFKRLNKKRKKKGYSLINSFSSHYNPELSFTFKC